MSQAPFAELIRAERIKRGLTQNKLAGLLKVAHGTVHQWESGARNPSGENLQRLADLTGNQEFCVTETTRDFQGQFCSRETAVQSEVDYILSNSGDKVAALLGLLTVQVAALVDAFEGVQ